MNHGILTRLLGTALLSALQLCAQPPGGRGGPPLSPRAAAPIDLTGYWVSVITEDWRYRMVTPAPGDYQGVPMTPQARKIADSWDPAKDEAAGEACKSYGAPGSLRLPSRLHFTWQDDQTMQLDLDAGTQTRVFHFGGWSAPTGPPSWQGDSVAQWDLQRPPGPPQPNAAPPKYGSMKVVTTRLKPGYLRKNGVPYSENTILTEYFDLVRQRSGDVWLVVTIVVADPVNLQQPFITSSQFKKQADGAGWEPSACSAKW